MEELIRVAAVSELTEMSPLCLEHLGVPYCVVKVGGEVRAFVTLCPHEDKVFTPDVSRDCLVCPFHNVTFEAASGRVSDRRGREVPVGLHQVETQVRDGEVYLSAREEHRILMSISAARAAARRARKRARRWLGAFGWRGR